jgi:hypothetical protein
MNALQTPGSGFTTASGVEGSAANIRVAHADPTLDRLTVHGLEANDEITATPGAASLVLLNLQP